ncbi:flagellar basal body P-ring formation protein FlgA [Rhizobium sp. KVB221]|uniref:Flagella basal body P-ring formation protein FlgA n=1 Tax=Rhizobium setariae TaxID=2801340 RepID=A0A936YIF5_9HYPH|nr:flagellar basal body P-ring formation chaperone FlgA [Rhizobium setariae]MBL0370678.1 flagellar basal body P-ring formation protein FlgA [Rhizobium setariae]
MMFGFQHSKKLKRVAVLAALPLICLFSGQVKAEELGVAVVPTQIIYPGEAVEADKLESVDVTNPNLLDGYARKVSEIEGLISTRTLLPGRTIMVSALREPYTVRRGDKIILVYDNDGLRITASGTPLADAITGALIKARNTDTGVIISGTVMADGSLLVAQK